MRSLALAIAALVIPAGAYGAAAAPQSIEPAAVLETDGVRLAIGKDGRAAALADRKTGKDLLDRERPVFVEIVRAGKTFPAVACSREGDLLAFTFGEAPGKLLLRATAKQGWIVLEVVSVDPPADGTAFGVLRLDLPGRSSGMSGVAQGKDFSFAARALDLRVEVALHGGPRPLFRPAASARRGIAGVKVALAGAPADRLRPLLKELVRAEGLPWSPLGGPFALDAPENRGSYVFATVSEASCDAWIALAKKGGLAEIHLIGWEETLGHYEPRKDLFPRGMEGLKSAVAKIHAAGLRAGMHTLTGGIARNDRFATPVPDPRLAKDGRFALAADLGADDATVPTADDPGDLETSWEYSGRSNIVQIGEELIAYSKVSRSPPFGLGGCTRGALGTRKAPHPKGAPVHHLFAIYGTFQPDEDSTLVDDVAGRIAAAFNTCGFDMIYQDGAEGMPGGPYGWARMREAVFRRLHGRVLVEASEWGTLSWPYHSRIGAWDHPNWGLKRFTDIHCRESAEYEASSLLAAEVGWWAILGPDGDHPAETRDEIEYLCAKALANDLAMSFQGIDAAAAAPWNARQDEYVELIGRWERLRLARAVPEEVRARLRAPGEDFRLEAAADGSPRFVPADHLAHKVTGLDDGSAAWTLRNRRGEQPARLRIEALYTAAPFDDPEGTTVLDPGRPEVTTTAAAPGMTPAWSPAPEKTPAGGAAALFTARSARPDRRGSWAAVRKEFKPELDLSRCGALGAWIRGDGKGEVLNFQLTNPDRFWPTWAEHYVDIDFEGWRYVELHFRERDADRFGDFEWPYGGTSAVFRSPLIRGHTSAISVYTNAVPPGGEAAVLIGAVRALPTGKVRLEEPAVEIGGARIVFPAVLESGQTIEMESPEACVLRDERGAAIAKVAPRGDVPRMVPGENRISFTCRGPDGRRARARVTVIALGEPIAAR